MFGAMSACLKPRPPHVQDGKGNTPLHFAAGYARGELARRLIEAGANGAVENVNGNTPLELVTCAFPSTRWQPSGPGVINDFPVLPLKKALVCARPQASLFSPGLMVAEKISALKVIGMQDVLECQINLPSRLLCCFACLAQNGLIT